VAPQFCIRALDHAEQSFTHLAEAVRGQQAAVDALLRGDQIAYRSSIARGEASAARVSPANQEDIANCRALSTPSAGQGVAEITSPSCVRSLEYFFRAFEHLRESISAMQVQIDALLSGDTNAYLRGKDRYADAFAKIRQVDAPLRADHTDCRAKAAGEEEEVRAQHIPATREASAAIGSKASAAQVTRRWWWEAGAVARTT